MRKIQELLFNSDAELAERKEMYYKSEKDIFQCTDGSKRLIKGGSFDFYTYYNTFPVKKWIKYTIGEKFRLVIEAKGAFELLVFGYVKYSKGYNKEIGGRYVYDLDKKSEIIIPIPESMRSEIISFEIKAVDDVYIYNAYYAADTNRNKDNDIKVLLLSDITGKKENVIDNLIKLKKELSDKKEYAIDFELAIYNPKDQALPGDMPENIRIIKDKAIISDIKKTYVLRFDNGMDLSVNGLGRLCVFLRMLKKEFKDNTVYGDIFDYDAPKNILIRGRESGASSDISHEDVSDPLVTAGSASESRKETDPGTSLLYCVSGAYFDKSSGTHHESEKAHIFLPGFCATGEGIAEGLQNDIDNETQLYKIQDVIPRQKVELELTRNMYYRSNGLIEYGEKGEYTFFDNMYYDFFTYFNILSVKKWKKFTKVKDLFLVLDIAGEFDAELFGHFKNKADYQKEWLGKNNYKLSSRRKIVIPIPGGIQSTVLSFGLFCRRDVKLYKAYYATDIEEDQIKSPLISMVTTTFKKEEYVRKNMELLTDNLLNDEEYKDNFVWNIIDNGRTLTAEDTPDERIKIFGNKNVGGAGGFAKGMMVSLEQKPLPTHILLMDDDVVFIPESFKRLCRLLSIIKEEHEERFISGAMLKMSHPNIQHEDIGWLNDEGYHEAVKPNYDLNLWNHILDNEEIIEDNDKQYAAWWFCCIPVGIARLDNLPLPVFVRGDDVEYSIRNKAKFITMNGICIWHEGFEGKFSAALEYYQVNRNELAIIASHPELSSVKCMDHIKMIFWEEMYKFNYRGASLLLDAIEDFMKGPEFFKTLDGEKSMKTKRKKDNQPLPMTPEIKARVDFDNLYNYEPVKGRMKFIYDYTYNGQARIPEGLLRKKTGIIPYGWGYFPAKMVLTDTNIAVNPANDTYVVFKKSRKKFNKLKDRFEQVIGRYERDRKKLEKAYQDSIKDSTSKSFWEEYLS